MKRRHLLLAIAVAGIAALALGFGWAAFWDRSSPASARTAVIPQGAALGEVATLLQERGVIAHPLAFRALARLSGSETRVEAGEYTFPAHESTAGVLRLLVLGQGQIARWVTFPEGFTADEVARALARRGLGDARAYEAWFMSNSIDLYGTRTRNLEGFLFPDTYLIPLPASPEVTARIMVDEFRRELPADAQARARQLGLTVPQVITVASLVEREAKADDERALMAGVYYNRLRLRMPLQVDATIEYALPQHAAVITRSDLRLDSPYNTYRYPGLPPTPIANPGRSSIMAAFFPKKSDFLYYVYMGNGHHAFARTYQEHSANVSRYLK
ncbi:MAG TPA: endolytic transglycosylase MltG [Candidatus Acidoferrales bacterium]|nr:endolytic transglycosylase MltG [Candidatus Acidoferrales bacterium]